MCLIPDWQLIELGEEIIKPFKASQVKTVEDAGVISWGVSSYGYDVRVADEYQIFHNGNAGIIDPKAFDPNSFVTIKGKGYCMVPPNSFVLCKTMEWVTVPRNCLVKVAAKSTYARCGLVVNATVLEPEWQGEVTLELSNTTPLPIIVYSGEGIVQLIFMTADMPCEVSYADRKGKYQGQRGITLPKV